MRNTPIVEAIPQKPNRMPDVSKNTKTGKHSQSKNTKISFNMKPDTELKFKEIHRMAMNTPWGAEMNKTKIFEITVNIAYEELVGKYEEQMRQHESID